MIQNSDTLTSNKKSQMDSEHIGTVVDNKDPDFKRRLKIRIPKIFDGDSGSLPWVYPYIDSGFGGSENYGVVSIPRIGSKVVVTFFNSDIYSPHYVYSSISQVPSEFKEDYPNSYGFKDESGNLLLINESKGSFDFKHTSGFEFSINESGDWKLISTGDGEVISKNIKFSADDKISLDAESEVTLKSLIIKLSATTIINLMSPIVKATGNIFDNIRSMAADRVIFNSHTHTGAHGETSPPNQQE